MRRVILSILLAGVAATPAVAQDHGRWRQNQEQSDAQPDGRQAAREARQERQAEAREQRSEARDFARARQQAQPQQPQVQVEQRRQWQGGGFERRNNADTTPVQQAQPQQQWQRRDRSNSNRDRSNWTGNREAQSGTWTRDGQSGRWQRGDLRQGDRPTPNVMRDPNPTIVDQQQQQARTGTWSGRTWTRNGNTRWSGTWNRDWRNDRRYDWRRYRDQHRSIFRLGIYIDPFGYNYYRPFNIGYRLPAYYFGQRYWIDPGLYNLPYPPPGTMWVRYWDDALLVDTYTGEVIDVIRNFFW